MFIFIEIESTLIVEDTSRQNVYIYIYVPSQVAHVDFGFYFFWMWENLGNLETVSTDIFFMGLSQIGQNPEFSKVTEILGPFQSLLFLPFQREVVAIYRIDKNLPSQNRQNVIVIFIEFSLFVHFFLKYIAQYLPCNNLCEYHLPWNYEPVWEGPITERQAQMRKHFTMT